MAMIIDDSESLRRVVSIAPAAAEMKEAGQMAEVRAFVAKPSKPAPLLNAVSKLTLP